MFFSIVDRWKSGVVYTSCEIISVLLFPDLDRHLYFISVLYISFGTAWKPFEIDHYSLCFWIFLAFYESFVAFFEIFDQFIRNRHFFAFRKQIDDFFSFGFRFHVYEIDHSIGFIGIYKKKAGSTIAFGRWDYRDDFRFD